MAVKAHAVCTLSAIRDISAVWRFYKIASSTAAVNAPTETEGKTFINSGTVPSGWSKAEPSYDGTSTNSLYTVELTSFTDDTISWSAVSKSSSYEAAKQAYNKSVQAEEAATDAAKTATTYITDIDSRKGITVKPSDSSGNDYLQIDSSSVSIYRNSAEVTKIEDSSIRLGKASGAAKTLIGATQISMYDSGNTVRLTLESTSGVVIGKASAGHATVNDNGLHIYDSANKLAASTTTAGLTLYSAGSKRASVTTNGLDIFGNDGSTSIASFGSSVRVGKTGASRIEISSTNFVFHAASAYSDGSSTGTTQIAKIAVDASVNRYGAGHAGGAYYQFCDDTSEPTYYSSFVPGAYGFMEGNHTKAQGAYSHAEGCYTYARGHRCHAEGCTTLAGVIGTSTSDIGNGYAHAEGHASQATGSASHAQNESTIAASSAQTAIGRYNVKDANGTYAFIIGNGSRTGDYEWPTHSASLAEWTVKSGCTVTRSNALTVDWNGCIRVKDVKLLTVASVVKDNISISANSYNADVNFSVAKTGYTPVGIVGFNFANASSSGTNSSHCHAYKAYISGTTANFDIRNHSSNAAKIKVTAYILYVAAGQGL